MGLLDFFKRKPKDPSPRVTLKMTYRTPDGREIDVDSDEYREIQEEEARRREEERRRAAELQESYKEFLAGAGVDVESFYPERVIGDVLSVIRTVCPPMSRFDHGIAHSEPVISFSSPTRTGKVPKNVVSAHLSKEVFHEEPTSVPGITIPRYGDRLSITTSYLLDGRINKVDMVGTHGATSISLSIRNVKNALRITGGQVTSLDGYDVRALYPSAVPDDPDESVSLLWDEVDRLFDE